jgi:hypothetical protein
LHSTQTEPRWILWLEWAFLLAVIILAAYLRYWRIEEVPPGFNSDEAVGAMGALTTLREGFKYSYEGQGGGGALGFYFATVAFYLFGPSIATIRGLAAWAGVVSILANYWAVREIFRDPFNVERSMLNRARWLAGLSTLGLAVSLWHVSTSRIAFAGIGVPFLMLPSVYFLWLGLNRASSPSLVAGLGWGRFWPFIVSGLFLSGLMYIYLSGVFAPPFYATFFIAQWLILKFWQKAPKAAILGPNLQSLISNLPTLSPPYAFLTRRFLYLLATGLTTAVLLLPVVYMLLVNPNLEPGATRVSQAFFMNPQINRGDPWGLLWRSIVGNLGAYGLSPLWFTGQPPAMVLPTFIGLCVFLGFLITLWRSLRGQAAYLFMLLWLPMLLLPSILSPDIIPHQLRTIGATSPVYVMAAVFIVWLFEVLLAAARCWLQPHLSQPAFKWLTIALTLTLTLALSWKLWPETTQSLYNYFYIFPNTNDAQAAYHVYAVKMAEEINRESRRDVAFILPRHTAAGDVARNFTTDFLTELAQPLAAHYWVIDDERTLATNLTQAAAEHNILRVVKWKTSKHTGADPKQVIPYYLEKFGRYDSTDTFEYFDIDTYQLDRPAPNLAAAEKVQPQAVDFGGQLRLTGLALGNAGDVSHVTTPQAHSNNLLWLRLNWQKTANHPENLKASALVYTKDGQLISQVDKLLQNNIMQVGSAKWPAEAQESTYFLIPIPPATPPGDYQLKLAVYGEESQTRLPIISLPINGKGVEDASPAVAEGSQGDTPPPVNGGGQGGVYPLANFTVLPAQTPVNLDDLKLTLPINQELAPGLTLVGFETLPGQSVRSGDRVGASLIWQAGDTPPAQDLAMSFSVNPPEGDEETPLSEPTPLAGGYPVNQWLPGELLRGWLTARIPPTQEPGIYKLRLRLSPAANPAQEVAVLPIGEFKIEGWPRVFTAPQPQLPINTNFNHQATLLGLDFPTLQPSNPKPQTLASNLLTFNLHPGDTLPLTLHWQAEAEFDRNYTAFVHLVGPDGLLYGQVDQIPGAGAYPTTGWLPGEYLTDSYTVSIAPDAPPGDYHLEIGLYDPDTGQRLPVFGPDCPPDSCQPLDNRVLLPGLTVAPS